MPCKCFARDIDWLYSLARHFPTLLTAGQDQLLADYLPKFWPERYSPHGMQRIQHPLACLEHACVRSDRERPFHPGLMPGVFEEGPELRHSA